MSQHRRVYIIGGGLAGMTAAYALARQGVSVTILEASSRLGGKAGADYDADWEMHLDHGFHIFPLWYANTRRLLEELGLTDRLIDTDTQHTITRPASPGQAGQWYTNYAVTSLRRLLHNVNNSPLRWHESAVGIYFLLDLAAASLRNSGFLDRVTVNGFFRSRFYRTEGLANFHHFLGLQASSIPGDSISAITFQTVLKGFMQYRSALVGMLRGDLQTQFIEPFRRRLEELGVRIVLDTCVQGLQTQGNRVCGLRLGPRVPIDGRVETDGGSVKMKGQINFEAPAAALLAEPPTPADVYILATPVEATLQFVTDEIYQLERLGPEDRPPLFGLHHLVSEPMAAFHIVFKRRLPHIPPWHTGLHQSHYALSFIDISQHWPELKSRDQTVLSVIAANFLELRSVPDPREQQRHLVDELLAYLRYDARGTKVINDDDIASVRLTSHVNAPLFLNTTGAWDNRPDGRTRLPNLFVTGDYCRSQADLTSMESAIGSALATTEMILAELGVPRQADAVARFATPPRWQLSALKWGLLPFVAPIGLWYSLQRHTPRRAARTQR